MRRDGFIGPNSCGIAPDVVELSCIVKFHGEIQPEMMWNKTGENHTPPGKITRIDSENNYLTYMLKLEADLTLDNSSYSCQIAQSSGNQFQCESGVISIISKSKI